MCVYPSVSPARRVAVTFVELLIVIAIIAILMALLIPAVQKVRSAAARAHCEHNLQQIAHALNNYEDKDRIYPRGAANNPGPYKHGWLVEILPYLEQKPAYSALNLSGVDTGWRNANIGTTLKDLRMEVLRCPLATVPKSSSYGTPTGTQLARMTYVGIAGSVSHPSARNWPTWNAPAAYQCYGVNNSILSVGGVLPHDRAVRTIDIKDGRSNTLMLGEQSDMCLDSNGQPADCGSSLMIAAGFYNDGNPRLYNMTTIRGSINDRSLNAAGVCGTGAWQGTNNPLLSPHSGIVMAAFCDGSVRPLFQTMGVGTLRNLADINDGNVNNVAE